MAYVKERTDLDLLRELNKQTEYNLLAGQSWVIDKDTGSYLSRLGINRNSPDNTEIGVELYLFYYQNILYDFKTAHSRRIEKNLYERKIIESNQPQASYDKDMLKLLESLYTIDQNYGDILCDKKFSDNKFVISLQF